MTHHLDLKNKKEPPTIEAGHVDVLEHLGCGEFGDVYLAQVNLAAFSNSKQPSSSHPVMMDLPLGATECLVALKKLKPDSNDETKKSFLVTGFIIF